MRFIVQRVSRASVTVEGQLAGSIQRGFLVLVGISHTDTMELADKMVKKLLGLRIFEDENGKTNLDLKNVGGSLLVVSQFTLYADCRKGNRPSFTKAGAPEPAEEIYEYILKRCSEEIPSVQRGSFGAQMQVELVNEGPFTIILDSAELGLEQGGGQ